MESEKLVEVLRLADALVRWSGTDLVEAVRVQERRLTPSKRNGTRRPILAPPHELRKGSPDDWMDASDGMGLERAWTALEDGLRARIETEQLYVSGLDATDQGNVARQSIPGVWAAEFQFDFEKNVIRRKTTRYLAVQVSDAPFNELPSTSNIPGSFGPQQIGEIGALDDDTLIALLHEQAKRVIARPNVKLLPPGILTVMPLIQGKMRSRAKLQTMLDTIGAESDWLWDWATSRTDLHFVPTPSTIRKVLSREYNLLCGRSTAAIQKLKR